MSPLCLCCGWVSQRRREINLYEDEEDIYLARLHCYRVATSMATIYYYIWGFKEEEET